MRIQRSGATATRRASSRSKATSLRSRASDGPPARLAAPSRASSAWRKGGADAYLISSTRQRGLDQPLDPPAAEGSRPRGGADGVVMPRARAACTAAVTWSGATPAAATSAIVRAGAVTRMPRRVTMSPGPRGWVVVWIATPSCGTRRRRLRGTVRCTRSAIVSAEVEDLERRLVGHDRLGRLAEPRRDDLVAGLDRVVPEPVEAPRERTNLPDRTWWLSSAELKPCSPPGQAVKQPACALATANSAS